jgi:hypothetical protein
VLRTNFRASLDDVTAAEDKLLFNAIQPVGLIERVPVLLRVGNAPLDGA